MSWRPWGSRPAADGSPLYFQDRAEAGRRLATLLEHLAGPNTVVLGLPRGGVPVAAEVAAALDARLDVIVVRKLGVPWQPELAMGAIGGSDVRVLNQELVDALDIDERQIDSVERDERRELDRRRRAFRGDVEYPDLSGAVAVIVDDGIATGSTALAACAVARAQGAARVVVAAPVAAPPAVEALRTQADEVVCLGTPDDFGAIGVFYDDFTQTSDAEVRRLLERTRGGVEEGEDRPD